MKILLSFLISFIALSSFGQKIRFTDVRNNWGSVANGPDCMYANRCYFYDGDTIISGKTYLRLYVGNTILPSVCTSFDYEYLNDYFIREDTLSGKVYYRHLDPRFPPDTAEHILYNYRLNPGDTISYNDGFGLICTDSVTSIDSVIIQGVYHRLINMQIKHPYTAYYTIVEGIGCTAGPLVPIYFFSCFEYGEQINCFAQNMHYPIMTIPFTGHLCASYDDTFTNATTCSCARAFPLFSETNTFNQTFVNITPNPAADFINITTDRPFDNNTTLSVYDITGRQLSNIPIAGKSGATISTTLWIPGVYLIDIRNRMGIIKKEKVVVLK